ncbi:MAG: HAD-IC family P-type ATPase [Thermoleophilia bacterium]|nr:HAD-IC family P-type ATPase [Thermoleophilia bacterium]
MNDPALPDALPLTGLTSAEVRERVKAGQTNITPRPGGRTTWDIIRSNVFTYFNLILGVLLVAMLVFGSWKDALFGWIIFINAGIGIVQEMRAKIALDRLSVLTAPAAKVVRDGEDREIPVADVVLDDVVRITAGDQIVADGETLESSSLEVDESLLTGESVPVVKEPGDKLLSGSFVVAGSGMFRATAVGSDAYAQRLTGEGKRYVRLTSDLVKGVNNILRVIGVGIVPVGALMIWAQFRMGATMEEGVTNTVAALVAMVPQGLVLLTSIAFAVSAIVLARRNVLTRELPAVEGLARVDVLCIDKTGTITEPHPAFEHYEALDAGDAGGPGAVRGGGLAAGDGGTPAPVDADPGRDALALQVLGMMAATASGRNSTLDAIGASLPAPAGWTLEDSVPFSSARKWSAARIADRGSWVLGAPEIVAADGAAPADGRARARAADLADDGLRVLLLSRTEAPLKGEMLPEGLKPLGLVILSERVRSDAPQTLAYFQQQGVDIKVISGDNPATVATIAAKAGVPGAERAIDARSLPQGEDLADLMESTTVFGRVDPDQKHAMVEALQRRGHTVAMTGDGVNDVLALKKADMGIAMGTGTAAAQAVSQLVLVDSRFSTLPGVVGEGRRVTANIERVSKLFTNKSVWAAILAIAVAAIGVSYPILPRHLTVIDALVIGIPGFFLALAPNPRRFIPGFVYRMARFVIPTGILAALVMLLSFLLLREVGATVAEAQAMETIIFCVIGWRVIAAIERPLRGWRLWLVLAMVAILAVGMAIPFTREFFAIDFPDWTAIGVTTGVCVFAWFFVGLGWQIGRRLPFWREAAARGEEAEEAARQG